MKKKKKKKKKKKEERRKRKKSHTQEHEESQSFRGLPIQRPQEKSSHLGGSRSPNMARKKKKKKMDKNLSFDEEEKETEGAYSKLEGLCIFVMKENVPLVAIDLLNHIDFHPSLHHFDSLTIDAGSFNVGQGRPQTAQDKGFPLRYRTGSSLMLVHRISRSFPILSNNWEIACCIYYLFIYSFLN
jgi:hypothetical protein